jgi:hypothetical protein
VHARRLTDRKSLLVALPLLHAAIITIYITRKGFLNTNDSQYLAVGYGIVVCHAIFDPMQYLTVVIWQSLTRNFPALMKGPMTPSLPDGDKKHGISGTGISRSSEPSRSEGDFTEAEEMSKTGPAFPTATKRAIQTVSKALARPRIARSVSA